MDHDDLFDSLADALAGPVPEPDDDGEWHPASLLDADWHSRRADRLAEKLDEVRGIAALQRARLDEWEAAQAQPIIDRQARHLRALEAFHRASIDAGGARTVNLPSGGRLRSQAGKLSVAVTDQGAFVDWAGAVAPDTLRVKVEVDKAEVSKRFGAKAAGESAAGEFPAVTVEGEIVPGVLIVRGDRRFFYDPAAKIEGAE